MPKAFVYIALCLVALAMIPPAVIARARAVNANARRIHIIQDMDNQSKFRAQQTNPMFLDGRAARQPVEGTVARGELRIDRHFHDGVVKGQWATTFPAQTPLTADLMRRGQDRFGIFCTPCHGQAGYGDGIVNKRAMELMENPLIGNGTNWVQPKSIHEPDIRVQPLGQLYNTVTHGVRNMSGYVSQIPVEDRWAIIAYVKALQRSQNAEPGDLSREQLETLQTIDLRPPDEEEE